MSDAKLVKLLSARVENLSAEVDALRAELAAEREAIKDAYFEGWGDANECGSADFDWSSSLAKCAYESPRIDAVLKGTQSDNPTQPTN